MSVKDLIYTTLKSSITEDISISYGFSESEIFPKIVFFNVTNYSERLSNKKTSKHYVYQVNFYDTKPHNIETSEILLSIQNALESTILNTGEWQEVIDVDSKGTERTDFMYHLEVRL